MAIRNLGVRHSGESNQDGALHHGVTALVHSDFLIEIEAFAVFPVSK